MSSDTVISVQNLSKRYVIGHESRHDNLRDTLHHTVRKLWRRFRWGTGFQTEEFWALRDVSFEIKRGEVVGIIGRNGAGKSTLLKILSRITEPTEGTVAIKGRVASLLEVGTGFHGELSGRENVFLNGAILGMSRAEIRRKFDEIVAFAEVERFLDTPVKHYSSGMYVRLAFAVAAHLDPEILIVDEVLSVGDASFQKKCLGKMQNVSQAEGRTVLFVSHNLGTIRQLCQSSILLAGGRIQALGPSRRVLDFYVQGNTDPDPVRVPVPGAEIRDWCYVAGVTIATPEGRPQVIFPVGGAWQLAFRIRVVRPVQGLVVTLKILTAEGNPVQAAWSPPKDLPCGDHEVVFRQDKVCLEAGSYCAYVDLKEGEHSIQQFQAMRFDINGEESVGYFPRTFGVGTVLNSMEIEFRRCPT